MSEVQRIRSVYGRRGPAMADAWNPLRPSQVMIDSARRRVWSQVLRADGVDVGRALEVGCGGGGILRWALDVGASAAVGIDLLPESIASASRRDQVGAYLVADGTRLPFRPGHFDTVVLSTVMSSILDDDVAGRLCREVDRVLGQAGRILWFDFVRRNPANPDVRAVRPGDVRRLFPGYRCRGEHVVLAPPLARRLEGHARLAAALEQVRPLRTHFAAVLDRDRR
jgi:SAM-dependent methyltransferase